VGELQLAGHVCVGACVSVCVPPAQERICSTYVCIGSGVVCVCVCVIGASIYDRTAELSRLCCVFRNSRCVALATVVCLGLCFLLYNRSRSERSSVIAISVKSSTRVHALLWTYDKTRRKERKRRARRASVSHKNPQTDTQSHPTAKEAQHKLSRRAHRSRY